MNFIAYYFKKFIRRIKNFFVGLDGRRRVKNLFFMSSFVVFVGLGLYMFGTYSTDVAYKLVSSVEKTLGIQRAIRQEGDNGDLNADTVDSYSVGSNVCSSIQAEGKDNDTGLNCTIVSATTPSANKKNYIYNSLETGKVLNVFYYEEFAQNLNQSAFFLNNNPGEQSKANGYYWKLNEGENAIAKFFSIFENAYDFTIRRGTEGYKEDNGGTCDVATANFCYFKISNEKYLNYYAVDFENRYILNASAGGYYFNIPENSYEHHYEVISPNDYKGVYIKEEYRQEYVKTDANGKKYNEVGFNSASYYLNGYYYLYDQNSHRFAKFSIDRNKFMWLNLSSTNGINSGYNSSHYYKNQNGDLYTLINDKDEATLRRYYEYDESVTETYYTATYQNVGYYAHDPNSTNTIPTDKYFETGNFKYINKFTLRVPVWKQEEWINEDYYVSTPQNTSNYKYEYLATKYQNVYIRNFAKFMNNTWAWGNTNIGYKNGYYFEITGTSENYGVWNKILNTVAVVLDSTRVPDVKDAWYYKSNPGKECSNLVVGDICYKQELSNNYKMFVQYGVSELFNRFKSLSKTDWLINNPSAGKGEYAGQDSTALGFTAYNDNGQAFKVNEGQGKKYNFTYNEYHWNSETKEYKYGPIDNLTSDPAIGNVLYDDNGLYKYKDLKRYYYNYGDSYDLYEHTSTYYDGEDYSLEDNLTFTKIGTTPFAGVGNNFYHINEIKNSSYDLILSSSGSPTDRPIRTEYYGRYFHKNDQINITYEVFSYIKDKHAFDGAWFTGYNKRTIAEKDRIEYWPTGHESHCNWNVVGYCSEYQTSKNYVQDVTITLSGSEIKAVVGNSYDASLHLGYGSSAFRDLVSSKIKTKLSSRLGSYATFKDTEYSAYNEIKDTNNQKDCHGNTTYDGDIVETVYFVNSVWDAYSYYVNNGAEVAESTSSNWVNADTLNNNISTSVEYVRVLFSETRVSNLSTKNQRLKIQSQSSKYINVANGATYFKKETTEFDDVIACQTVTSDTRYVYNFNSDQEYAIIYKNYGSSPFNSAGGPHADYSRLPSFFNDIRDGKYLFNKKATKGQTFFDGGRLDVFNGIYSLMGIYAITETWTSVSKSGYFVYDPNKKYIASSSNKSDPNSYLYTANNSLFSNTYYANQVNFPTIEAIKNCFNGLSRQNNSINSKLPLLDNFAVSVSNKTFYQKENIKLYKSINPNSKTYYFGNISSTQVNQKNNDLLTSNHLFDNEVLFNYYQGYYDNKAYKINGYGASYNDGYDSNAHNVITDNSGILKTWSKYIIKNTDVKTTITSKVEVKSAPVNSVSNGINGTADGSKNESILPTSYSSEQKCVIANGSSKCSYYTYEKIRNDIKTMYKVYKRTQETTELKNNSTIYVTGYSYQNAVNYAKNPKVKVDISTKDTSTYTTNICNSNKLQTLGECYELKRTDVLGKRYAKIRIANRVLDHYEEKTNDFKETVSFNTSNVNNNIGGNIPLCSADYDKNPENTDKHVPCYKYKEQRQEKEYLKYSYKPNSRKVKTERMFVNTFDSNGNYVNPVSANVSIKNLFDLNSFIDKKKFTSNSKGEIIFDTNSIYEQIISNASGTYTITLYGSNLNGSVVYINGSKKILNGNNKQSISFNANGNLIVKIIGSEFKGTLERVMLNSGTFSYYIPYGYNATDNKLSLEKTTRVNKIEHKFFLSPKYEIWQNAEEGETVFNDSYFSQSFSADIEKINFIDNYLVKNPYYNKYIYYFNGENRELIPDSKNSRVQYRIFKYYGKNVVTLKVKQYDRHVFFIGANSENVLSANYFNDESKKITVNIKDVISLNNEAKKYSKYDNVNKGNIYYSDIRSNFPTSNFGFYKENSDDSTFIYKNGKMYIKKNNTNTYYYDYAQFDIKHTYPKELEFNTQQEAQTYLDSLFINSINSQTNIKGNNFTTLQVGSISKDGVFSTIASNDPKSKYRIIQNTNGKFVIQLIYKANKTNFAFADNAKIEFFDDDTNNTSGTFVFGDNVNSKGINKYISSKFFFKLFNSEHKNIKFEEGVESSYTNYKDATFYLFDKYKISGKWNNISGNDLVDNKLSNLYNKWTIGLGVTDTAQQKSFAKIDGKLIFNFYGVDNNPNNFKNASLDSWKNNFSKKQIVAFDFTDSNQLQLLNFEGNVKFYYAFNLSKLNFKNNIDSIDETSYSNPSIVKFGFGTTINTALGDTSENLKLNGFIIKELTLEELNKLLDGSSSRTNNRVLLEVHEYDKNNKLVFGRLALYIPIRLENTSNVLTRYALQTSTKNYVVSGIETYNNLTNGKTSKIISLINIGFDRDSYIDFKSLSRIQTFGNKILTFEGSGNKKSEEHFGVSENFLLSDLLVSSKGDTSRIPEFILKNEGLSDINYVGATFRSSTGESYLNSKGCFLFWCWNQNESTQSKDREEYRTKVWQYNSLSDRGVKKSKGFNYSVYALKEFYDITNPSIKNNYYNAVKNSVRKKLTNINTVFRYNNISNAKFKEIIEIDPKTGSFNEGGYEVRGRLYEGLYKLLEEKNDVLYTIKDDLINILSTNYVTITVDVSSSYLKLKIEENKRHLHTVNSYFDDYGIGLKNETILEDPYILDFNFDESTNDVNAVLSYYRNVNDIGKILKIDFNNANKPELYFVKKGTIVYVYQKVLNTYFINGPQTYTPYTFRLDQKGKTPSPNSIAGIFANESGLKQETYEMVIDPITGSKENKIVLTDKNLSFDEIFDADTFKSNSVNICNGGFNGYCTLNLLFQTRIDNYVPIAGSLFSPSNYFYGTGKIANDPKINKNKGFVTYEMAYMSFGHEYHTRFKVINGRNGENGIPYDKGVYTFDNNGPAKLITVNKNLNQWVVNGKLSGISIGDESKKTTNPKDGDILYIKKIDGSDKVSATYDFFPTVSEKVNSYESYTNNFFTNVNGMQLFEIPFRKDAESLKHTFLINRGSCSIFGGCEGANEFGDSSVLYNPHKSKKDLTFEQAGHITAENLGNLFLGNWLSVIFGDYKLEFNLYTFEELINDKKIDIHLYGVFVQDHSGTLGGFWGLKNTIRPMIFVCGSNNPSECFGVKKGASLVNNLANKGVYDIDDIEKRNMFMGYLAGSGRNFSNLYTSFFSGRNYEFIDWEHMFQTNDTYYINPTMIMEDERPWYCFGAECSKSGYEMSISEILNAGPIGFYYTLMWYSNNFNLFGGIDGQRDFMNKIIVENPVRFDGMNDEVKYYLQFEDNYSSVAQSKGSKENNDAVGYYHTSTIFPYVYNKDYVSVRSTGQDVYDRVMGTTTVKTPIADWLSRQILRQTKYVDWSKVGRDHKAVGGHGGVVDKDSRVNKTTYVFDIDVSKHNVVVDKKYDELFDESFTGYDYSIYTYLNTNPSNPYEKNKFLKDYNETKNLGVCPIGFTYNKDGKCYLIGNINYQVGNNIKTIPINKEDYFIESSLTNKNGTKEGIQYATLDFDNKFETNSTKKFIIGNENAGETYDNQLVRLPADMDIYFTIRPRYENGLVGEEKTFKIHTGTDFVQNPYGNRFIEAVNKKQTNSPYYFTSNEVNTPISVSVNGGYINNSGSVVKNNTTYPNASYTSDILLGPNEKLNISVNELSKLGYARYSTSGDALETLSSRTSIVTPIVSPIEVNSLEIVGNGSTTERIVIYSDKSLNGISIYASNKDTNKPSNIKDWTQNLIDRRHLDLFYSYSKKYYDNNSDLSLGYNPNPDYLDLDFDYVTSIPDRLRLQYTVETMGITSIHWKIVESSKNENDLNATSTIPFLTVSLENGYGPNKKTFITTHPVQNISGFEFNLLSDPTATIGTSINKYLEDFYQKNNINELRPEHLSCHTERDKNGCISKGIPDFNYANEVIFNNNVNSPYGAFNLRFDEYEKGSSYSSDFNKAMENLKGTEFKIYYKYEYNPGGESVFLNIDQDYYAKNKSKLITWEKRFDDKNADLSSLELKKLNINGKPVLNPISVHTNSNIVGDAYNIIANKIQNEPIINIKGTGSYIQPIWQVSENKYVVIKYFDVWYLAKLNKDGTFGVIVNRN